METIIEDRYARSDVKDRRKRLQQRERRQGLRQDSSTRSRK